MNEKIKMDEFLAHHGVLGQRWGKWNDETRRKYFGSGKNKSDKIKLNEKDSEINSEEQSDIKKRYGLDVKEYNAIREKTLKSNDPKVVAKGMKLLSDSELNEKISRLEKEDRIRQMASKQRINEANAKKAELERRKSTLPYKLGETVANTITKQVTSQFVNKTIKPITDSVSSSLGKTGVKAINSMKKAVKEEKNKKSKTDDTPDKATEIKSEIGKEAVNTIRKSWKTVPKGSRYGMKNKTKNQIVSERVGV